MSMTVNHALNHALSSMWISPSFALKGYPVRQVGQLTIGKAPDPPKHFILDGLEYRGIRRDTQHSERTQKSHQRSIPHWWHLCENNKIIFHRFNASSSVTSDKFNSSCYSDWLSWLPACLQSPACARSAGPAELLCCPSPRSAGSTGPDTWQHRWQICLALPTTEALPVEWMHFQQVWLVLYIHMEMTSPPSWPVHCPDRSA